MIHQVRTIVGLVLLIGAASAAATEPPRNASPPTSPRQKPFPADGEQRLARTAWMREAKWGVAIHFMREFIEHHRVQGKVTPEAWKRLVDDFDVETLADQSEEIGAGYVLIGLSQCGGYFLAPNATYDRLLGRDEQTSWFPKRDVIRELGEALRKRGVALVIYLPIEPPVRGDPEAVRVLRPIGQQHPTDGHVISDDEGWRHFVGQWEPVVREYSTRWGDLVSGWWFDGGWFGQLAYEDGPNWDTFMAAARAGNPRAAVAINHQYQNLRKLPLPREDYFAGEVTHPDSIFASCAFRHQVVQDQVLTYLGNTWGLGSQPRYSQEQLEKIARNVVHGGCVLTWDVPFQLDGTLHPAFVDHLIAFNRAARRSPLEQWKSRTGGKMIPPGNLAFGKRAALLSRRVAYTNRLQQFPELLPPNSEKHFAENGVDGDPNTLAMGSKYWDWAYLVDLLEKQSIGRIVLNFDEERFPTHYQVWISEDGLGWRMVEENKQSRGGKAVIACTQQKVRYIRVESLKPDGPNQEGYSMAITELQAFAE